jgi:hypothetical protein
MQPLLLLALAFTSSFPSSADEIAALRAQGPSALERLLERYRSEPPGPAHDALEATIDAVAAQRYATVSGLYWYTDLDQAEEAARASGKPILSLRMLGRLDEDLSCANSRFFRVALYANTNVSRFLRDSFVLHWSSERPVPKVTIDFGDGRAIHTTLAGNSAHYVLDADGRVIDVLPGLYSPVAFQRELEALLPLARLSPELGDADRAARIRQAWEAHEAGLAAVWSIGPIEWEHAQHFPAVVPAEELTRSKMKLERPLLPPLVPGISAPGVSGGRAAARVPESRLDASSKALFERLVGESLLSQQLDACVADFELSMAADTMQNELGLRPSIHSIALRSSTLPSFEDLNRLVYEWVFLTPDSDPWLGLRVSGVFNGLPNGGLSR